MEKTFLLHLSAHWGDFNRANKKKSVKHTFRLNINQVNLVKSSLGEVEKAVETLTYGLCSHSFFEFFQTFPGVSITQ